MLLCTALISLAASLDAASVRAPGVQVDVGGPYGYYYYYDNAYYQAWAGPGWYYGIWFDYPDDYYYWLNNGFYDVRWGGPGYYYGVYFNDEPYFNDYRRYHRYYGRTDGGAIPPTTRRKIEVNGIAKISVDLRSRSDRPTTVDLLLMEI